MTDTQHKTLDSFTSNDTTTSSTANQSTTERSPSDELVEQLEANNIRSSQIETITDRCKTIYSVIEATDSELLSLDGIGEKTVAKIRDNIDSTNDVSYSVTETDDGEYTISNWALRDTKRKIINQAEEIILTFRKKEYFGHHRKISDALTNWASEHRDNGFETFDREFCNQVYELTPHELNTGILFDHDETFESPDAAVGALESAYQKARVIVAFCGDTDHQEVLTEAKEEVKSAIKKKEQERKEKRRQEQQAEDFLADPPGEVNGWTFVPTPVDGVIAYNGEFQDRYCVVALFDDGDVIRIRAFAHDKWKTIDWEADDLGSELYDNTESHGTANFPETMKEGAQDMLEFLRKDWFEFSPDEIPDPYYPC